MLSEAGEANRDRAESEDVMCMSLTPSKKDARKTGEEADESENIRLTSTVPTSEEAQKVPLWTVWKGNNHFMCGGRVITGPERGPFCGTVAMVGVPMFLFFSFVLPKLLEYDDSAYLWAPPMSMIGFGWIYTCLFLAHGTDPGIIAREPKRQKYLPRIISRVLEDGTTVRMRWCDTCHIYRPPRCHHCSDCGNCVEVFDHHCPWIGNCVARRNYRYFIGFLLSTATMLLFTFSASLHMLLLVSWDKSDFNAALAQEPVSMVLMLYTALIFMPVACLAGYHGVIISSGETTKEEVKRLFKDSDNPYDRGCLTNWWITLCTRPPPSKLTMLRDMVIPTYLDDDIPEEEEEDDEEDYDDGAQVGTAMDSPEMENNPVTEPLVTPDRPDESSAAMSSVDTKGAETPVTDDGDEGSMHVVEMDNLSGNGTAE